MNLVVIPETRTTFWAALPLFIPLIALAGGLALVLASVTVVFRDVEHLLAAILLPWFFLTPVFYTFDLLPGSADHPTLVDAPPLREPGRAVRDRDPRPALLRRSCRSSATSIYVFVAALVALVVAALVFRRLDDQLAAQL